VIPSVDANALGMKDLNLQILENKYNLPWRYYVGILGMSGQTAYYGLKDISDPKPGDRRMWRCRPVCFVMLSILLLD
jgi:NADPH-dependent curcumin reductase CurA